MASTWKKKGIERRQQRPSADDGYPDELHVVLDDLQREIPGFVPAHVLGLLSGLVTDRVTYTCERLTGPLEAHAMCPPDAPIRGTHIEHAVVPLIKRKQAMDPKQRRDWDEFKARVKPQNQRLHSARTWLGTLEIPGGPRKCPECGARSPAARTIWCGSTCPPDRADGKTRKQRILDELEAGRLTLNGLQPLVPARGEASVLGWLPRFAFPLAGYLAQVAAQKPDSIPIYRLTARILRAATGDKRITTEAVRARLQRAHAPPLK